MTDPHARFKLGVVGLRGLPDVPGGVETHCAELCPRLAAAGVDVTVYARSAYVGKERTWRGVRVVPLRAPRRSGLEAAVHTWRAIFEARRDGCDVLYVNSVGPGLMLPVGRLLGMRTVFVVHGPDYLQRKWGPLARAYLRLGEWVGVRYADEVISVSEHQRQVLQRHYGRSIHFVPNGAPVPTYRAPGPLLASFGLQGGDYVLFVGRLIPDKRLEDLISALRLLPDHPPLVVVGEAGGTPDYVEDLHEHAGRDVIFAGWRTGEELAELLSNAHVFVLPSAVEGLPVALLEALAYGIPCVASDIPANSEVLADGKAGRLVPLGDVPGLAAAVGELWTDAEARSRLIAAGRERVASSYDWDCIAAATLDIVVSAWRRSVEGLRNRRGEPA